MAGWLPDEISSLATGIDGLLGALLGLTGLWFVGLHALLVVLLLRNRARPGRAARCDAGNTWSRRLWVLAPAALVLLLDAGIEIESARVWAGLRGSAASDAVVVKAVAAQFRWQFVYPGPDGRLDTEDDVSLLNELHVPLDRDVEVRLESQDVVHSFFLPNLRRKQDVLPGRTIPFRFRAGRAGSFEIACAELCGFGHYTMGARLFVHEPAGYRDWWQEQWPTTVEGASPEAGGEGA